MGKRVHPQYLDMHGKKYRVQMKVPVRLRKIVGKAKLLKPLYTENLREAEQRKWAAIADLKQILRDAERVLLADNPLKAEALTFRPYREDDDAMYHMRERAREIERAHSYAEAQQFADLARGATTPLDQYSAAFIEHQGYRLKTRGDFERALRWLGDYLRGKHLGETLEAVTRKEAGLFITTFLVKGRGLDKAAAYLTFLRQYWKWLYEKGNAGDNPWLGQTLPTAPRRSRDEVDDEGKRPFTDEEVAKLVHAPANERLKDIMLIGALSGMRIEEVCQLRIADCADGVFSVRAGKTEAARRKVPIHTGLKDRISALTKGRAPAEFLIADLPGPPKSRETRSDPAVKQFTRYRRELGVDERPNEKAKSNVDFHSFRRWFIRKARDAMLKGNAGFDAWTFLSVVGHSEGGGPKAQELSMVGYAGPDAEAAKRALVEAVKLPLVPNS